MLRLVLISQQLFLSASEYCAVANQWKKRWESVNCSGVFSQNVQARLRKRPCPCLYSLLFPIGVTAALASLLLLKVSQCFHYKPPLLRISHKCVSLIYFGLNHNSSWPGNGGVLICSLNLYAHFSINLGHLQNRLFLTHILILKDSKHGWSPLDDWFLQNTSQWFPHLVPKQYWQLIACYLRNYGYQALLFNRGRVTSEKWKSERKVLLLGTISVSKQKVAFQNGLCTQLAIGHSTIPRTDYENYFCHWTGNKKTLESKSCILQTSLEIKYSMGYL